MSCLQRTCRAASLWFVVSLILPVSLSAQETEPEISIVSRSSKAGWMNEDGQSHEKIYDIAWADTERRSIGADGKLDAVGNTVDVTDATWTNSIADPDLTAWWTDPYFDPSESAFYYTRILEIPTPTWQAYDQVRYGSNMTNDVPMSHQERAWSSPIWYTP